MLVGQAPPNLVYPHNIPGSRCGPEDGQRPRPFRILKDADIWRELSALARPQTWNFQVSNTLASKQVECVNFQPCSRIRTQDRYVVQKLDINGKPWVLTGVFDGHMGDLTVKHVVQHLPVVIRDTLREAFRKQSDRNFTPQFISHLLSQCITSFDNTIAQDVLNLFPGGLSAYSDAEIRRTINDQYTGGENYDKVRLCVYGTTALVALVDPERENLWVANLGDCQAVLVSSGRSQDWNIEVLTSTHNGDNDAEVDRIMREHPDEPECVVNGRILGALAPTRCLGDVAFKQPPEFTHRILFNLLPGFRDTSPWEEFLNRNLTPPYISSAPEVTHRRLHSGYAQYLILNSDGFTDLVEDRGHHRVISKWVHQLPSGGYDGSPSNIALRLLRDALGGEDEVAVSAVLTLDMDVPWIDDITIVVQQL